MRRIAVVNTGASTLKLVLVEVDDIHLREIERAHYDWEPDTNRADVLRSTSFSVLCNFSLHIFKSSDTRFTLSES